jgi:hypothetical protein
VLEPPQSPSDAQEEVDVAGALWLAEPDLAQGRALN